MKHNRFCRWNQAKIAFLLMLSLAALCTAVTIPSCRRHTVPKEYGYFRIDLPQHAYTPLDDNTLPYSFLLGNLAEIQHIDRDNEIYWIDINYTSLNAVIHCSYKPVRHNLPDLTADAIEFVFSHAVKASAIPEQEFDNPQQHVYGVLFNIEGNAATPVQFFLTDSTRHFFRAALYFNNIPNSDSLAPVTQFIREDINTMIESFHWKK